METKTITIDLEAYERLRDARLDEGESFSETIKRIVKRRAEVEGWLERAKRSELSDEAAQAIEEQIQNRRRAS